MGGFEEDYEAIEENHKHFPLDYAEWIFFSFGIEPNSNLDKCLARAANHPKCFQKGYEKFSWEKERDALKLFALELLESGEVIFEMSEKYRKMSNGGMGHT